MLLNSKRKTDKLAINAEGKAGTGKWVALIAAYLMIVLMLKWPENTIESARNAMDQWYHNIVPSLLPFMMLMPLITSREAAYIYEKTMGKIMGLLFGLPGSAAPAIVTAMVAGSPAGAIAATRIAVQTEMRRKQLLRIAGCMCGLSPAFLVSGIGLGMMDDANVGALLLKTQILTQISMLFITRRYSGGEVIVGDVDKDISTNPPIVSVLNIACYMVLFSVVACIITELAGEGIAKYTVCALEVTAGTGLIAKTALKPETRMLIIAMMCGFGGLSLFTQNVKILGKHGIKAMDYMKWKVASSLVSGMFMAIQLNLVDTKQNLASASWLETTSLVVLTLIFPVIMALNNRFLNKRIF